MTEHVCEQCGQECLYHLTATADDGDVCDNCVQDFIEVNGELYADTEVTFCAISDEYVLNDDTFCCDDCLGAFHTDYSESVNGHTQTICTTCLENGDYSYPEDGTGAYHIDELYWSEYDDCYYCDPDRANRSTDYLYPYETNIFDVAIHRKWVNRKPQSGLCGSDLLFGVELECDSRDCSSDDIAMALQNAGCSEAYAIFKEDSTVSGLELVTLPADLESHKHAYSWDRWCETMRPLARGHHASDAGMHVHINRAAVSALTLGKMLVFTNAVENLEPLSVIAQRDISRCGWCRPNPAKFDKVGKAAADPCDGKYSVLNVTTYTIENRMFNSNLQHERVLKNIEFCHALVKFCENTSARQLTWSRFQEFVAYERKTYNNLHQYIVDRFADDCSHQLAA